MRFAFFLSIVLLLASGCAPKTTVVLLPDEAGKVGAVEVATNRTSQLLDTPNAYTEVWLLDTPSKVRLMSAHDIDRDFSTALRAEPLPPKSFNLYFHSETTTLDRPSASRFPDIAETIRTTPHVEINVIGHTDTAGDASYNWDLSRRRAERIRDKLLEHGVDSGIIFTSFHGQYDPLIPTPDETHEPRNRRVEIFLR